MKIIQIMSAPSGNAQDHGHEIYGLGDDGNLYEFVLGYSARAWDGNGTFIGDEDIVKRQEANLYVRFTDGDTRGWRLLCQSGASSKKVPHPLDPSRHDRS